jgi:hypothetical protein
MNRYILVSGVLLAFLIAPATFAAAELDCSKQEPPTGSIQVTGPQVRVGDRLIAGPGARIEVKATDAAGGAATWTPTIDGREESGWPASWTAGEHSAGATAVDSCGRRATLAPVAFVVDVEPPALRWETGDAKTFIDTNRLAPDTERDRRRIRHARKDAPPADDSWISQAGVWQVPLSWVKNPDQTFLARDQYPVLIANTEPQAFLAAPGTVVSVDGSDTGLGQRLLWIAAEDPGAGVERLTLTLSPNGQSRAATEVLKVEVTDLVGNTSRKEIVLRPGGEQKSR